MLTHLHIRNFILIDSLDVEFPEGLIIITGQTGAGKSILLGALALASGAKADASMISEGADSCVVEASFRTSDPSVRSLLEEQDLDWCEGELIIRRQLSSSGRSRAFVNDCPVTVQVLQALSSRLIDVHSQHCSLLLSDRNFQLSVLDQFCRNADPLSRCKFLWQSLKSADAEIEELSYRKASLDAESEYNRSQWEQLNAAGLKDGELEMLEEEQKKLANAELIKNSFTAALSGLGALQDLPVGGDVRSVSDCLRDCRRELEHASRFVPACEELSSRLDSVRIELDDISSEIQSLNDSIVVSEERLQTVEERMSLIYTLMRKHSCSSVAELISLRDSYSDKLADSDTLEERIEALRKERDSFYSQYISVCEELTAARRESARRMAAQISESLSFLELDRAVFQVRVAPGPDSAAGRDVIDFLFSSNGTAPQEVQKCASGGEMSRIMLCIKAMMAEFASMPTLIFDEIDTGVSGSVADKMGQMICNMGRNMQVFAITHLPQVAAKGRAHYLVSKSARSDGRNVSSISELDNDARVAEIARMLSGSVVTDAAIANARALLSESVKAGN